MTWIIDICIRSSDANKQLKISKETCYLDVKNLQCPEEDKIKIENIINKLLKLKLF